MAIIKLSNTKSANRLISYCEKKAVNMDGVDCPVRYAKSQMAATRELYGKTGGVQAHHVIQSFKPGEITPEQANQIGRELAEKIAPGHEVTVYTHADTAHVHNHLVINSVSLENGRKYHSSQKDLHRIREQSDRLCQERGLHIVKEPTAQKRFSQAESGLSKRGQTSWKDEIRKAADKERAQADSLDQFKERMAKNHGIEVRERGKSITFVDQEGHRVRGQRLGLAYEKNALIHELNKSGPEKIASKLQGMKDQYIKLDGQIRAQVQYSNQIKNQAQQLSGQVQRMSSDLTALNMAQAKMDEYKAQRASLGMFKGKEKKALDQSISHMDNSRKQGLADFQRRHKITPDQAPAMIQKLSDQAKSLQQEKTQLPDIGKLKEQQKTLELEYKREKVLADLHPDGEKVQELLAKNKRPSGESTQERIDKANAESRLENISKSDHQEIIKTLDKDQAKKLEDSLKQKEKQLSRERIRER